MSFKNSKKHRIPENLTFEVPLEEHISL